MASRSTNGDAGCTSASLWEREPRRETLLFNFRRGYIYIYIYSVSASDPSFLFFCRFRPRSCRPKFGQSMQPTPLFVGRARVTSGCASSAARFSLPPSLSPRVRFSYFSYLLLILPASLPRAPFAPSEVARRRQDRGCESRKSRTRGGIAADVAIAVIFAPVFPHSRVRGGKARRAGDGWDGSRVGGREGEKRNKRRVLHRDGIPARVISPTGHVHP